MNENNIIFSLDIGTRNVVGTIAQMVGDRYVVKDYEVVPHPERAMYDGQIHDIDKVAQVVNGVRTRLEERTGQALTQVAIAAAGRALRTKAVRVKRDLDYTAEIDKVVMDSLEMEGIQLAQTELAQKDPNVESRYYCVGYSVVNYYLDGSMISNPRGHRGAVLESELIATFLPHIVVDSLYTVMDRVGLEVISLTLEPIAAINVAIPQHLRLLNLALVDVGAGTSDIAITRDGAVVSYGMVAMAGDRVTEALSREFLLDFNTAESVKINLQHEEEVSFTDIVGIPQTLGREQILGRLDTTVDKITSEIAKQIVEVNDQAPSAVFCIGGGCQVPGFTEKLATFIGLPPERVVIKGAEALEKVEFETTPLLGPENITPVGIGFSAFTERDHDFLQVTVNDKQIRLFNSKQMTVSDALILVGYNARKLLAERGTSVSYTLDGKQKLLMGDYGEPAVIYVNSIVSSLDTKIHNKDVIYVEPAVPGKSRQASVKDILPLMDYVMVNGVETPLVTEIRVGGQVVEADYLIQSEDQVQTTKLHNLYDVLHLLEIAADQATIQVDGQGVVDYRTTIEKGMNITITLGESVQEGVDLAQKDHGRTASNLAPEAADPGHEDDGIGLADSDHEVDKELEELNATEGFEVVKEPLPAANPPETPEVSLRDYFLLVNGQQVHIEGLRRDMVFVDVFDHIDFDISKPKGILDLKLNGERARYTDFLKTGDVIEIKWR